jgi:hypothetical protein
MKRIMEIREESGVVNTGLDQHGFKCKRRTSTQSVTLQSMTARALNEGKYGLVI